MFGREDNSLSSILSTFTKAKAKLETFISNNTATMDSLNHELQVRQGEDKQAKQALEQITKIVG